MSFHEKDDSFLQRILKSKWLAYLVNLPGISWLVARGASRLITDELASLEARSYFTSSPKTESSVPVKIPQGRHGQLDYIVASVVNDLGYVGAFLSLYEQGDVLSIYSYYVRYDLISYEQIQAIEEQISQIMNQKMSLSDPEVARVYLYNEEHANNLSIRAVKSGQPVIDKELFSLFTPIVPDVSRPIFRGIQERFGIQEVVAVPFTIDYYSTVTDDSQPERPLETDAIQFKREIVGTLFAVSTVKFTPQKINVLRAFGYQAAAAIQNSYYKRQSAITQRLISHFQHTVQTEQETFDEIVRVIVTELNYVAAMISITDTQNTLHIKAYRMAREANTDKSLIEWQQTLSDISGLNINLQQLDLINLDLNDVQNDSNLAYKVMESQQVMTSTSMYSLFRPMLPGSTLELVESIQSEIGVRSILAIPLISYELSKHKNTNNCIGVLFVASRSRGFTSQEVDLLKTVGEQVALNFLSEKRRQAERFARMAFNANTSLHVLNGHIGAIRMALNLLKLPENEENFEANSEWLNIAQDRVEETSDLLGHLAEPFIDQDKAINMMSSITRALEKLDTDLKNYEIQTSVNVINAIPPIYAFKEMLTQIFYILVRRAMNAIIAVEQKNGEIKINIDFLDKSGVFIATIDDNGGVISQEELSKIFDIQGNTQDSFVGFGLFWANEYISGMGGSITIEPIHPDKTRTILTIPVRPQYDTN